MADYSLVTFLQVANAESALRSERLVLVGKAFKLPVGKSHRAAGVFLCKCGDYCVKFLGDVSSGKTKSCGCLRKEVCFKNVSLKHGMHKSDEFRCWVNLKQRCLNRNHNSYADYGGRGIKVCERWLGTNGFVNFLTDMGSKPGKDYSIDRIDNHKDYCPENCRWATCLQQAKNKRNNRFVECKGEIMTIAEWARRTGDNLATLRWRARNGWSDEEIVLGRMRREDGTPFGVRVDD